MDIAESSRKAAERAELLDDVECMTDATVALAIGSHDPVFGDPQYGLDIATRRRMAAIDDLFPFLAQYGRTMSESLVYELGIIASCVRLRTVRTHADLVERLKLIRARTQSDRDVLRLIAASREPDQLMSQACSRSFSSATSPASGPKW